MVDYGNVVNVQENERPFIWDDLRQVARVSLVGTFSKNWTLPAGTGSIDHGSLMIFLSKC